jgi:hypothetical protein
VITEVDDALCVLLGRSLPEGTMVRLDPPKPTWQTERPSKAIDLFLFGLHDEHAAESGSVRRCRLSYLVTARAPKISEEHQLLDIALRVMIITATLPVDCLPAALARAGGPVRLKVAETDPGGLWSSLGMPARAAFVVSVSAPFLPEPDAEAGSPSDNGRVRTAGGGA